jgi:hypothetical protein
MSYYQRYIDGDYEQVWKDLFGLGSEVRREPIYSDALAVAAETMQRVRHTIEVLIHRLTRLGFSFGYDHRIQPHFSEPPSFDSRQDYLNAFLWARQQPPVFLAARHAKEEKEAFEHILWDSNEDQNEEEELPDMATLIHEVEQEKGTVPLSLKAWYEYVGGVNFHGYSAPWERILALPANQHLFPTSLMAECDPLMISPLLPTTKALFEAAFIQEAGEQVLFFWAPDRYFKDYFGGAGSPYGCQLPDERADFLVYSFEPETPVSFVEYLRTSLLTYAGFPGMARWSVLPREDLDVLTRGLRPF